MKPLNKKQLNQLLVLIDPQHPPPNPHDHKTNTMCTRATKFMAMKAKIKKRGTASDISKLEAEPPVDLNAQVKRGRGLGPGRATTALECAPDSPTKERPSQRHCHQPSPGRKQMGAIRLDMSKLGAEFANLKSQIKAQNKKETAIEQEARTRTTSCDSAYTAKSRAVNYSEPHVHFCCWGLCILLPPPGAAVCVIIIGFIIFFCKCKCTNTQHVHGAHQHATCTTGSRILHQQSHLIEGLVTMNAQGTAELDAVTHACAAAEKERVAEEKKRMAAEKKAAAAEKQLANLENTRTQIFLKTQFMCG
jgi:hypothetical protein